MKPVDFDYVAPRTVAETLALLAQWGGEATIMAGGQSLLPLLVARSVRPRYVIDIGRVAELDVIDEDAGGVRIGAAVRQADCEDSPVVRRACPLLVAAIGWIASLPVRNRGTVVGSLAQRNAVSQIATVAVALGARLRIASANGGERIVTAEHFVDARSPETLRPGELVLDCWFPALPDGTAWGFYEVQRRAAHYALVSAAVAYARGSAGNATAVRVAASGLAACPVRLAGVEAAVDGNAPTPMLLRAAAQRASDDSMLDPIDDLHATAAYRRAVAPAIIERALLAAAS
jgi:carbon-monoxide dehydrogenase medium subunit